MKKTPTPLIDSAAKRKQGAAFSSRALLKPGSTPRTGAAPQTRALSATRGASSNASAGAKKAEAAPGKRIAVPVLHFGQGLKADGTPARTLREWLDDQRAQGKPVPKVFRLAGVPSHIARVKAGKVLA